MESTLEGSTKPYQTSALVTYILERKQACSADAALSTQQIIDAYHELLSKHKNIVNIPDNSISTYLSLIAGNEDFPIHCEGKKKGYFLDLNFNKGQEMQSENPVARDPKENEMYPLLVQWLSTQGFSKSQDISAKRAMGQWANPDVIGIRLLDIINFAFLEVVTIEAKRDFENWRKDIFEAVAHTMFANRSYYAYLCKESDKVSKQMVSYAQKFRIGILALIVPDDMWGKPLSIEDIEFREILPAPEQKPDLAMQKDFLFNLGIYDLNSYEQFACK